MTMHFMPTGLRVSCDLRQMGNVFALVVFTDVGETVNDLICTVEAASEIF